MNERRVIIGGALLLLVALGCSEGTAVDSRFATPERTVATLLAAHGVDDATTAEELATRLAGGGLEVIDRERRDACFADLDQPGGEGMADYVLGMLAVTGTRDLRVQLAGERAYVSPRDNVRIVMLRGGDGAYRIVLAESVSADARRAIPGL